MFIIFGEYCSSDESEELDSFNTEDEAEAMMDEYFEALPDWVFWLEEADGVL